MEGYRKKKRNETTFCLVEGERPKKQEEIGGGKVGASLDNARTYYVSRRSERGKNKGEGKKFECCLLYTARYSTSGRLRGSVEGEGRGFRRRGKAMPGNADCAAHTPERRHARGRREKKKEKRKEKGNNRQEWEKEDHYTLLSEGKVKKERKKHGGGRILDEHQHFEC